MRADMKKVLTERPRVGSSYRYHEFRLRYNHLDEDLDTSIHEGMRYIYGYERKSFSDLLGPLKRYLFSCIGRPWNDVWSEVCANLSNNTVDAHLKQHVLMEVEIHTEMVDGKVSIKGESRYRSNFEGLYVHPETGILCYRKKTPSLLKKDFFKDGIWYYEKYGIWYPINSFNYCRKIIKYGEIEAVYIKGIWYWVVFAINQTSLNVTDKITKQEVKPGLKYRSYFKKQMSSEDLNKYRLVNA